MDRANLIALALTTHTRTLIMADIPDTTALIDEFTDRHNMRSGEHVRREALPIRASSLANTLITSAYSRLGDAVLADPAVGLLLNLLHRNFEVVEGAIVAFSAQCGQAAEVAARASVEASVNITYIASGDAPKRIQAYFDHYFSTVDKQVKTWSGSDSGTRWCRAAAHASCGQDDGP
jgi:hypothetical protein